MVQKVLKGVVLLMIAALLSSLSLKGYYPFVIGWFAALCTMRGVPQIAIPIIVYGIYESGGVLPMMKYGIFMLALVPFLSLYRKNAKKYQFFSVAFLVLPFGLAMEGMDWILGGQHKEELLTVVPVVLLEWSTTAIFTLIVQKVMWYIPKKTKQWEDWKREQIEWGEEMLQASGAFRKMAMKIRGLSCTENNQPPPMDHYVEKEIENLCYGCENGQVQYMERMKLNYLWYNKMLETREAMAIQLNEMAGLMENFTKQSEIGKRHLWGMENYMKRLLKEQKILTKRIMLRINSKDRVEVRLLARKGKRSELKTEVIESTLERALARPMRRSKNSLPELTESFQEFRFFEDVNFCTVSGSAKRVRQNQPVSGDNYTYMETDSGQTFMSICDGMGSGQRARNYSEMIIDLLEQLLDSGFHEDTALKLINSVMLSGNQWQEPAALDMALIDRYSGICQFLKMGAACTYIKRGNWVECIKSTSLPLGVMENVDMETITKKLYDGDFVIMVSDGIVEALQCEDKEEFMGRIIMEIDTLNPREMALQILSHALEKTNGIPMDDMTIICTGIWERMD
ncbi:MAG: SpoIIE family protein phosphatase [Eubacterium sp.]|nr:SpoIIE family protein phosphatase [Eubacterium sp.]